MKKTCILFLCIILAASVSGLALAGEGAVLFATPYGDYTEYALFDGPDGVSTWGNTLYCRDGNKLYCYEGNTLSASGSMTESPSSMQATEGGLFALSEQGNFFRYAKEGSTLSATQFSLSGVPSTTRAFADFVLLGNNLAVLAKNQTESTGGQSYWTVQRYLYDGEVFTFSLERIIYANPQSTDICLAYYGQTVYYAISEGLSYRLYSFPSDFTSSTTDTVLGEVHTGTAAKAISADNTGIYVLTELALVGYNSTGDTLALKEYSGNSAFIRGAIGKGNAISAHKGTVTVADAKSHSVQSFFVSDGAFKEGGLSLFGASEERWSSPLAVAHANGESYVLDAGNSRILSAKAELRYPQTLSPKGISVTAGGTVYLATENGLHRAADEGFSTIPSLTFTSITDLTAYSGDSLLLLADGKLYEISAGEKRALPIAAENASAISYNEKDGSFYLLSGKTVTVLDAEGKVTETVTLPLAATDFTVDFGGNLYALSGSTLTVYNAKQKSFSILSLQSELTSYHTVEASAIDFNSETGDLLLTLPDMHAVLYLSKESVGAVAATDIPDWIPFSAEAPSSFSDSLSLGTVVGAPSTLLYPYVSTEKIRHLSAGDTVILLEEVRGEYWLAHVNGTFGYLLKYGVSVTEKKAASYTDCRTLTARTALFGLPTFTKTERGDYRYREMELGADSSVSAIQILGEHEGAVWLSVSMAGTQYYLTQSEVYEARATDYPIYDYLTVSATPKDAAPLYAAPDTASDVLAEIPNGEELAVLDQTEGWKKVLWQREEGNLIGWVQVSHVREKGLTSLQKVGILLLVALIVIGIITLIVRRKQK
ncbi:MAG: SH3 domain-containing protein [Clostridia bacterium]|nr:SH3 domain-containing protein [Clostridia bacterium]